MTTTTTTKLVQTVERAISGQGKAIDAIRELVTTKEGTAALAQRAERYADVAESASCEEVKRLRALIRKAGTFMATGTQNAYRLANEGEEGAPLTVKFTKGCATIEFATTRKASSACPIEKALAAYIKACKEGGINLEQATAMVEGEWTSEDSEPAF